MDLTRSSAALFGRESELAELEAALEDAASGRGRLVLVGGEPGIGKTRLVDEFARHAERRTAAVFWGRAWEAGGAPPYWPFVESLRGLVETTEPAALREDLGRGVSELAQLVPEVRQRLGEVPEPAPADPDTARFRLFDAVSSFLVRASGRRPFVIVLDDLHAADEPSLLLLRFVARTLHRSRAMVVGTYRETEVTREHPLTRAIEDLAREPVTTRLSLSGLDEDDVASYVAAATGQGPSAGLVRAIHRETEGNPLFVGEVLRLLVADGGLDRPPADGSWGALIPGRVRDVIGLRVARLSRRCVETLTLASVVGRDFSIDVLEQLAGMERAELLDVIDEAADARVVAEIPSTPGRMRFSHQLIRDVLYEELGPGQRAAMHRRVARALEGARVADRGRLLAELAHHYFSAATSGEADKAVRYCSRAGDRAASVLAYEEAARLYGMALVAFDLAPEIDDEIRPDLLVRLGEAQARAGDAVAAKETFLRAADLAEALGMHEHLARAALGYGGRFVWARAAGDRELIALLERALRALADDQGALRARLLARLAGALRDEFDPDRRDRLSREAVEIARGLADPLTLAYVLDGRWAAIWGPDSTGDRLRLAEELIRVAEGARDRERSFQGHHYRMICLLELGDVAGAREELDLKARAAAELRQPAQEWYLRVTRALLAAFEGRLDEAERESEEALAIGERAYSRWDATFNHRVRIFVIRRDQDRLAELETTIRGSIPEYEMSYPFVRALLALLLAESGQREEAEDLVGSFVHDGRVWLPRDNEWLFGMAILSEVVSILGDRERAALLYDELAPYAGMNVIAPVEAMVGAVDRPLGLVAATSGRRAEAERHFREAFEMNRRMGAEPAAARTLLNRAQVALSPDGGGNGDHAAEWLEEAHGIARRRGLEAIARRSEALLRGIGQRPTVPRRVAATFMFTDIVGSTQLLHAIGDEEWENLRTWHHRTLRGLFVEHGGREVSHAGDGFFVVFAEPAAAIRCAVQIQRRLADHRRVHGFAPHVRIGLHTGQATAGDETYSGRAVHEAARIGALAEGGQILASSSTFREAGVDVSDVRDVALRGIAEPVTVGLVAWRQGLRD